MMLAISLASLRMRTVSHAGALPPWSGRLATPVLYIGIQHLLLVWIVILFLFTRSCIIVVQDAFWTAN
jgi:hypothetical protein